MHLRCTALVEALSANFLSMACRVQNMVIQYSTQRSRTSSRVTVQYSEYVKKTEGNTRHDGTAVLSDPGGDTPLGPLGLGVSLTSNPPLARNAINANGRNPRFDAPTFVLR